uniref:RNA-directed DNA polymerase n=1 Tax=Culicoides sonorensis TaxID=179676 RepID=A0A336MPS3_CULSO
MGLINEDMRRQIIQSNPVTLEEAMAVAQTCELSDQLASNQSSHIYRINGRSSSFNGSRFNGRRFQNSSNFENSRGQNYAQSQSNGNRSRSIRNCRRCGFNFHRYSCPAINWFCDACGKKGHIAKCCQNFRNGAHKLDIDEANQVQENTFKLGKCEFNKTCTVTTEPALYINVNVNGILIKCEVDCGAAIGVMSYIFYKKYFSECSVKKIDNKIFTLADDSKCEIYGLIDVILNNKYASQAIIINTKNEGIPLMGRTWLSLIFPNWRSFFTNTKINKIQENYSEANLIQEIKKKFSQVFEARNNPIINFTAHLNLKEGSVPKFRKASIVPFSLREEVEKKLLELEKNNIIKRVEFSDWASQLVIVPKKDGSIRLCSNYKATLNPCLERNDYPIPNIDDILFKLNGNKFFTVLDLSGAYLQLALDEESQKLTTINTPLGLFSFCRLPFGVKTAPGIFQEVIDRIINGIKGVVSYFDDILISATSIEECRERTHIVFEKLQKYNVQVNLEKCIFFSNKIEYLGHEISEKGVATTKKKIEAIEKACCPRDLTSLRSFLGLLNFYSKFLPNLQPKLHPLHELLKKGVAFKWTDECESVFKQVKAEILSSPILAFFDLSKPLSLVCDAGPYGVGAILNISENGIERPVYMASATLSKAEENYSQLHREALAIVFGVKKFHKFIYGTPVVVYTDCQALATLLSGKKDLGNIMNSRFLRWILFLQNYDLTVKFRPSKDTINADALSRLPASVPTNINLIKLNVPSCLNHFNESENELLNIEMIRESQSCFKDLYDMILNGWINKDKIPDHLKIFYKFKDSLDIQDKCIFYGNRVLIPPLLRDKALDLLHKSHLGIVKCKQIARSCMWWPKIDVDIENFINSCKSCQINASRRSNTPLMSWPATNYPFERIHIDHFFFQDKIFLIIVDDFSKFIDVKENVSVSTKCVVKSLKEFFSYFGFPKILVSDNGSCFNSEDFNYFCYINNITHLNSPQYHPESNGLAERLVGVTKNSLKKSLQQDLNNGLKLEDKILNFLFKYRNSPVSTHMTPCQAIFKYNVKNNLSVLSRQAQSGNYPQVGQSEMRTQYPSTHQTVKTFETGSEIFYYHKLKKKWVKGHVLKRISELVYEIKLELGSIIRAHAQNLKNCKVEDNIIMERVEKKGLRRSLRLKGGECSV